MSTNNMPSIENLKTSNRGYELHCEYRNFPVSFVNALRRIVLSGVPTVVVRDVQILENTTQIPHEMLKHRVQMLPINITPDDVSAVRDAQIELRMVSDKDNLLVTTNDFVVNSSRPKILLRDRDFDTPILFLRLRPGESVHIKASLSIEAQEKTASQVCVGTTSWHVDKESQIYKDERKKWEERKELAAFDNFYYQQAYSRDEVTGRPNWINMDIESIGVLSAKDILKYAVTILKNKIQTYVKESSEFVTREKEDNSFSIKYDFKVKEDCHTVGVLMQEVIYNDLNVDFVSYDMPHPLRSTMVLRMHTKKTPESILKTAVQTIEEYCSIVEKVL